MAIKVRSTVGTYQGISLSAAVTVSEKICWTRSRLQAVKGFTCTYARVFKSLVIIFILPGLPHKKKIRFLLKTCRTEKLQWETNEALFLCRMTHRQKIQKSVSLFFNYRYASFEA